MIERVLTIGAYGFDERTFMHALVSAGVDLFVDLRARRGMRGSTYAFANAVRLQSSLGSAGIRYAHARELAPTPEVRRVQQHADRAARTAKRDRTLLASTFLVAYTRKCLTGFDPEQFAKTYLECAKNPVLFCVERDPKACHRSLVAARLAEAFTVPIHNLLP